MTEPEKKTGRMNYLVIILTVFPIIVLFQLALTAAMGIKGVNNLARQQLMNHTFTAGQQASSILFFRHYEPMEMLSAAGIMDDSKEIVEVLKRYPEVTQLYKINKSGRYAIYSGVESSRLFDSISALASSIYDTLALDFKKSYWDDSVIHTDIPVTIEGLDYIFTFCKKKGQSLLVVTDPRKLIPLLDEIFDQGIKKRPYSRNYFSSEGDFTAEVKLYIAGVEFYSYDHPAGNGWIDTWDSDLTILPWKMSVQIFSRDKHLIYAAGQAGKIPWPPFVEAALAGVIIIFLAVWGGRLRTK